MEQLEDRSLPSSYIAASGSELIADINAANLTAEADTITLVAGKTFTLNAVDNTTHGATGLPTIAATENLTILGNGDTIARSTVAGTPAFRLFDVAAGASLTLQNLTLQGGLAFGYGVWAQGGAVYNQGTLTLDGAIIQGNTAQGNDGGRVWTSNAPGGNAAGGGVYSNGVLTMTGCTVQNNSATGGRGANSFVYDSCQGTADPGPNCGNTKAPGSDGGNGLGGGVYVAGGTATIRSTTITSNTAQGGAGGSGGGSKGQGGGVGIYIDVSVSVGLDAFTVDHVKRNHASTSDDNIHGSYGVIV